MLEEALEKLDAGERHPAKVLGPIVPGRTDGDAEDGRAQTALAFSLGFRPNSYAAQRFVVSASITLSHAFSSTDYLEGAHQGTHVREQA
jgi:hypothetical protein